MPPAAEPASPLTPASRVSAVPAAANSSQPVVTEASPPSRTLTANERAAACREIGLFLRRCLAGEHRGASGRDRIPQASRYWLVLRDFAGANLEPAVVCHRFADCARLCKRGSDLGDSICIGLPARQDIIAVAAAVDVALPASW